MFALLRYRLTPLRRRSFAAVLLSLGLVCGAVHADSTLPVPPLTRHVVDHAGLLQPTQADELDRRLWQFEKSHGSQIAVLIVPTTQPESIEQYSIRVFEAWKLGRKQHNDGILVTVAVQDRKLRIDTGYGLEGALPDAIGKRIVSETIAPRFRAGDPYAGLVAGVEQIEKLIEGERLPPAKQGQNIQGGQGDFGELLVIGIIAATIVGSVLSLVLGRFFGGLATGGLVGFIAWLMTSSLIVMSGTAIIVFLYVLVTAGRGGSSFGSWGGGGWSSGGGWGGGGGGWGGGGGGSAGGGGASGSW